MHWSFLLPRYWPTWLVLGFLYGLSPLPFRVQLRVGAALGVLARWVLPAHARVARRNLALCLPELAEGERERLLRGHFRSLGMTMAETVAAWRMTAEELRALVRFEGLEHLDRAVATGRGAILLAAHFTTLEIAAGFIAVTRPTQVVFKRAENRLVTAILAARRGAAPGGATPSDDIRSMVRALRAGGVVWYAPDQAYRWKSAEMVPFFGIPAATNTATARLARLTGAHVLPFFAERLPGAKGYRVTIHPPLGNYPSGDRVADARRFHELIEAHVRRVPEQYLWVHRRFKGLAADYPDYYSA